MAPLNGVTTVDPVRGTERAPGNDGAGAVPVMLGDNLENAFSTNGWRPVAHRSPDVAASWRISCGAAED
jgi:hypothetical protein